MSTEAMARVEAYLEAYKKADLNEIIHIVFDGTGNAVELRLNDLDFLFEQAWKYGDLD